eukprot:26470-Pleurochrysis_carterae.AAC.1
MDKGYPVSSGLLALAGISPTSWQMHSARKLEAREGVTPRLPTAPSSSSARENTAAEPPPQPQPQPQPPMKRVQPSRKRAKTVVVESDVGDVGRGLRLVSVSLAVIGFGLSAAEQFEQHDIVRLRMRGGGRRFPAMPRLHVFQAPHRKRTLPKKETFDRSAARQAAAKISDLRRQLATTSAELQQLKRTCERTTQSTVRVEVRRARGDPADVTANLELVAAKEEVQKLRRAANHHKYFSNQHARVKELEGHVADCDSKIVELAKKLAAAEKCEQVQKRHLATVTNTLSARDAERKANLKKRKNTDAELSAREAGLKAD